MKIWAGRRGVHWMEGQMVLKKLIRVDCHTAMARGCKCEWSARAASLQLDPALGSSALGQVNG